MLAPLVGILVAGVAMLMMRWIIKKFWQPPIKHSTPVNGSKVNTLTPTSATSTPLTSDGCTSSTLTESNNTLAQRAFDGVNRNPEAEVTPNLSSGTEQDLSKLELPELAHESNLNVVRIKDEQPNNQQPK